MNNEAKTLDPPKNLDDQEAKSVDKGKRKTDVAQPENSTDAVVVGEPVVSPMSLGKVSWCFVVEFLLNL